jgi:D-alanyl-lipoteichoic acid acyltransferase DltB (MBOAT superfamily)
MLFGTPLFLFGFLPFTLGCFALATRIWGGNAALGVLLCASFVFYGYGNKADCLLLAASILGNWWIAPKVAQRSWFVAGIAANLGLLGLFKYGGLIARSLDLPAPPLALPIGISFFTFQQLMVLRAARDTRPDRSLRGFLSYANCIAFFAHLLAGPLVRPSEIIPQIEASPQTALRAQDAAEGLMRIFLGLAKKLVLADSFAPLANQGFAAADHGMVLTLVEAWVALLAFGLQIYFDFSGYSDIAIGLARLFGIRFPENFNSPYKALTIQDFWHRWNMTLSRFLRDFVYIPLGGNRHGAPRRLANLMLTMLLGGLWHGAAWRFLLWGAVHGLYLVLHQLWDRAAPAWARLPRFLAHGMTLLLVLLAWVPFRAPDMAATVAMLRGLIGLNGVALPAPLIALVPALGRIVGAAPVLPGLGDARTLSLPEAAALLAFGWFIVLALPNLNQASARLRAMGLLASGGLMIQALFFAGIAEPFLYFRF